MSMRMTAEDLIQLADKLRELEKVGIEVVKIRVAPHDIYLDSTTKGQFVVVGITNKQIEEIPKQPTYRN